MTHIRWVAGIALAVLAGAGLLLVASRPSHTEDGGSAPRFGASHVAASDSRPAVRRTSRDNADRDEKPFQADKPVRRDGAGEETDAVCMRLAAAVEAGEHAGLMECRRLLLGIGEAAVPRLARLAACGNPDVEIEALRLLTQVGGVRAIAAALARMLTFEGTEPHFDDCIAVFGQCREHAVVEWLTELTATCDSPALRRRAMRILTRLRSETVAVALAEAVERYECDDSELTVVFLLAISQLDDPVHVVPLATVAEPDGNALVSEAAALALANIGTSEAVHSLADLAVASDYENGALFRSALAGVTSPRGQEALIGIAADTTLPDDLRAAAAISLARHDSRRVATVLDNIASSQDTILASAARTAIETQFSNDQTTMDSIEESCFFYRKESGE